jgi:hypothetical protein
MEEELYRCNHCDRDLPRSQFYKDKKRKSGITAYCKAYYAGYYKQNTARQRDTSQRARIKRRYGLEWDEYQRLLADGCCVCGSAKDLHVDHDHETGETRGILCRNCNVALGHVGDCPSRLRKLADWIESKPVIAQGLPGQSY